MGLPSPKMRVTFFPLFCVIAAFASGIPTKRIAPGVHLPMVGLGTWQYNSTRTQAAVLSALKLGYSAIDTAHDYDNQVGIGQALKQSQLPRDAYFITTKLEGGLSYADTLSTHAQNLQQLGLEWVDLLLIHFPTTMTASPVGNATMRQAQWRAMELLQLTGKTRAVGVSHFCRRQMQDILDVALIKPAVNQVEFHIGMGSSDGNATDDRAFMEQQGITFQSFSPLCGPCPEPQNKVLLTGPMVSEIGARVNKTGAQVSLKWQVQQGIPVIPKSDNPMHMRENLELFGWELSEADMKQLNAAATPMAAGGGGDGTSGDCQLP